MYISVEDYYDMYLKDKNEETVAMELEKMRMSIDDLKRKIESPLYSYGSGMPISEGSVVAIYRDYFNRAADHLAKMRGIASVLTEEEKRALIIDSMLPSLSALTLTVGSYLQYKYTLSVTDTSAFVTFNSLDGRSERRELNRDAVLAELAELHLGEWRDLYTPEQYGCTLNDPDKWQIRIEYKNGSAPYFSDGIGIYPYNFNVLCDILGVDVI